MSQIDKLNFLPVLLWFILFYSLLYFIVFSFFTPLTFVSLYVREQFYILLLVEASFFNFLFLNFSFVNIFYTKVLTHLESCLCLFFQSFIFHRISIHSVVIIVALLVLS